MVEEKEIFELPKRFEDKLGKNKATVYDIIERLGAVYIENKLDFFDEYTDHGWRHINAVLKAADDLIPDETFVLLTSNDVLLLVSSVFLHDVGMHTTLPVFRQLVSAANDKCVFPALDETPWPLLWSEYLDEARKFSSAKRLQIFGKEEVDIKVPNLHDSDSLDGTQKKLIGEFIRRHHPRIAHEIAINGLIISNSKSEDFFRPRVEKDIKDLCGLLARSHGMEIRDSSKYLNAKYGKGWKQPYQTHIHYLMVVLRMADYFQVDASRVLKIPYETREFQSPVSRSEHQKHLQTKNAEPLTDDPETMFIYAIPESSTFYVGLSKLFKSMQRELDTSWAVLGEMYGALPAHKQMKIKYRRIDSNIFDKGFSEQIDYVPDEIHFTIDKEIPKLLIAPLYGDNPTYGVRELIQNAVDACLERDRLEKQREIYKASIDVKLYEEDGNYYFFIQDNGKGMTIEEIQKYFLTVGGTYRKSADWYKKFVDKDGHSTVRRSGRFGIGVLAAYLLGASVEVTTKSQASEVGYAFGCDLEADFIDIRKKVDIKIGTTIKIQISKFIFDTLSSNTSLYKNELKYYEWFKLSMPQISYSVNDHVIRPAELYSFTEDEKWNEICINGFASVRWKYDGILHKKSTVICNGIVVPGGYEFRDIYIRKVPTISVFDNDAKVSLSLNRNSLAAGFEFEEELKKDIMTSALWGILNFQSSAKIDEEFLDVQHNEMYSHPALLGDLYSIYPEFKIMYAKDGFTLTGKMFESRVKNHDFVEAVNFYTEGIDRYQRNIKLEIEYLSKYFLRIINIRRSMLAPESYIKKYTDDNYSRIDYIITSEEIKLRMLANTYDVYEKPVPTIFRQMYERLGMDILIVMKNSDRQRSDRFGQLIDYYLDGDPIIPYKMEDRKKKFPKAFKELAKYPLYNEQLPTILKP